MGHSKSARGKSLLLEKASEDGGGRNLGTKSSARGVATRSLQGGPALSSPAFLAPVFASGGTGVSENWSAPSENKRTEPLPFCLLVPTDL